MLDLIKLRIQHGHQAISDLRNAKLMDTHRGFPLIDESKCEEGCVSCKNVCPTDAISLHPLSIDLGKCIFCGECERACHSGAITFTSEFRLGTNNKNRLVISSGQSFIDFDTEAIKSTREIHRLFGRSLKLRQVSAAGCNGCEMELAACSNVNFDIGRFGIDFVASPRHADGIVLTGPVSKNMAPALMDAYDSMSDPKIVVAAGACAMSGGIFESSGEIDRSFFDEIKIDLFIPGCPPHPLTFIHALLDFIGRRA